MQKTSSRIICYFTFESYVCQMKLNYDELSFQTNPSRFHYGDIKSRDIACNIRAKGF